MSIKSGQPEPWPEPLASWPLGLTLRNQRGNNDFVLKYERDYAIPPGRHVVKTAVCDAVLVSGFPDGATFNKEVPKPYRNEALYWALDGSRFVGYFLHNGMVVESSAPIAAALYTTKQ